MADDRHRELYERVLAVGAQSVARIQKSRSPAALLGSWMARMLTRLEHSPSEPDPAKLLPGCLRREVQIARVGYLDARGRDFQNGQLVMETRNTAAGTPILNVYLLAVSAWLVGGEGGGGTCRQPLRPVSVPRAGQRHCAQLRN